MGNRVKGKTKQKSIKAASHSGMGSKRKLSRMGKKQQKNRSGLDATFLGRSACLKKLQITLKDFRRLCILKGVYPREPRGRTPMKKKGQVYYHVKDVRALAHEPILAKFREFRAFMRRVRRAAGRKEGDEAKRLQGLSPTYTLHHLVRERYPRFGDALGDLDDALALVYLYAALPSKGRVVGRITKKAQVLAGHWGSYCAVTSSVTKTFVSVKGVYMEAEVEGVCVRWVVPHSFTQNVPDDVDFRVMNTFFEFYETLLGFVLFKLYKDLGVGYPLANVGDKEVREEGCVGASYRKGLEACLRGEGRLTAGGVVTEAIKEDAESATTTTTTTEEKDQKEDKKKTKLSPKERRLIQSVDSALVHLPDDSDSEDDSQEIDVATPLLAALESVQKDRTSTLGTSPDHALTLSPAALLRKSLFRNLTVFLSREIPKGYVELVALSYGATVGWDGPDSPVAVDDPSVTHHLVDRPGLVPKKLYEGLPKSREYVQPQWLLDSANFNLVLPVGRYGVGESLPPHLSPWVDDGEVGYVPKYAEEIKRLREDGVMVSTEDAGELEEEEQLKDKETALVLKEGEEGDSSEDEKDSDDDEEEEEDADEDEIDAKTKEKTDKQKEKAAEEEKLLARGMMSKKANRLYGRMQHGIAKKQAVVDNLHRKRKEIETDNKRRTPEGHTIGKAKVERLKDERRTIEKEYKEKKGEGSGTMKKRKRVRNKNRNR